MKRLVFLVFFWLLVFSIGAQTTTIERLRAEVAANNPQDTLLEIFDWLTHHISYDMDKYQSIHDQSIYQEMERFSSQEDYQIFSMQQTLETGMGICEDYTFLFDTLARSFGYETMVILGYTKNSSEHLAGTVGHTWNAVKVDGEWKLYDLTWGAGYILNGDRFVSAPDRAWYDVHPDSMIATHMPYDPVWQLSDHPISYHEFDLGLVSDSAITDFDYDSLIEAGFRQNEKQQIEAQKQRSKLLGEGNILVATWRSNLDITLLNLHQREVGAILDRATNLSNEAIRDWNAYALAKNNRTMSDLLQGESQRDYLLRTKEKINEALRQYDLALQMDDTHADQIDLAQRNSANVTNYIEAELKRMSSH